MVARFVRDEEGAGSNPVTPTSVCAVQRHLPAMRGCLCCVVHRPFLAPLMARIAPRLISLSEKRGIVGRSSLPMSNARTSGSRKPGTRRGGYRVNYAVQEDTRVIEIEHIGRRSDVYR